MLLKLKRNKNNYFKTKLTVEEKSYVISSGQLIFELISKDDRLSNYLSNTLADFHSGLKADYTFKFNKISKKVNSESFPEESTQYIFDFVRFFDTFFYYRSDKSNNTIDVILPNKYEYWEIENFLKLFISSRSYIHGSLLLHASAIIVEGEVVLFTGQSGAGKSTIAEMSEHAIIHDDNILLTHLGNGMFKFETVAFKTPYVKKSFEGKIRGFYRLFQESSTYIKEVNIDKQLTHLLFGLWAFNYFQCSTTKNYNENVLNHCFTLLPYLKMKELYFEKNQKFIELI